MEQGIATRVPNLLRAHETLIRGLEVPGLDVCQGMFIADPPPNDFIMIGVGWEDRPPGVEVEISQESSGLSLKPIETVTLRHVLSTLAGDPELSLLDRYDWCADVLGQIDLAMRADPKLDGACDMCWLGDEIRYYSGQTPDGAVVTAAFETYARSWL